MNVHTQDFWHHPFESRPQGNGGRVQSNSFCANPPKSKFRLQFHTLFLRCLTLFFQFSEFLSWNGFEALDYVHFHTTNGAMRGRIRDFTYVVFAFSPPFFFFSFLVFLSFLLFHHFHWKKIPPLFFNCLQVKRKERDSGNVRQHISFREDCHRPSHQLWYSARCSSGKTEGEGFWEGAPRNELQRGTVWQNNKGLWSTRIQKREVCFPSFPS